MNIYFKQGSTNWYELADICYENELMIYLKADYITKAFPYTIRDITRYFSITEDELWEIYHAILEDDSELLTFYYLKYPRS